MATKLARFKDALRKYPWDKWMNGEPWRAKHGKDFECSPVVFRSMLYGQAKRKNRTVKVCRKEATVDFQFSTPEAAN